MMKKLLIYCLLLTSLLYSGCRRDAKKINWSLSLDKGDKNPYGSYLAYESLKYFFPGSKISSLSQGFRYSNIDYQMKYDSGTALLVLTGLRFELSDEELEQIMSFASAGNEIVLFCSMLDKKLGEKLNCYKRTMYEDQPLNQFNDGEFNINALYFTRDSSIRYGYRGRTINHWFTLADTASNVIEYEEEGSDTSGSKELTSLTDTTQTDYSELMDTSVTVAEEDNDTKIDTSSLPEEEYTETETEDDNAAGYISPSPEILGMAQGSPDFIRYEVGYGHITLHAAPLVTSNYFLLQDKNLAYLEGIWNTLPSNISHIYWNSYYMHRPEHSDFGILWRNPATRWALMLSIITLCLYVLLELKRRQKPIPVIRPLENTSVSFVETVGRLYYNKGNHHNLAEKMTQHFLEWIRTHYYLNTSHLNDAFVQKLANKSGLPIEVAANMVEMIHEIRMGSITIDEAYLYHLNNTIQRFYTKP